MDYKEYIESGKLESYVLGTCTAEEALEAECMARVFPEVRRELEAIRISLEQVALKNKIEPPAALKAKILAAIENDTESSAAEEKGKIISMIPPSPSGGSSLKLVAAACVALLLVSSFVLYNFYTTNNKLKEEVAQLQVQQTESQKANDRLAEEMANAGRQMQILSDPLTTRVSMKGQAISPASLATVYWEKNSKEVYIAVNSLPKPPEGKQYQLWGIVNGAPVDLGVFDVSERNTVFLQHMKEVDNASAFAVTLEKAGGSPTPTLTEMYVMGGI